MGASESKFGLPSEATRLTRTGRKDRFDRHIDVPVSRVTPFVLFRGTSPRRRTMDRTKQHQRQRKHPDIVVNDETTFIEAKPEAAARWMAVTAAGEPLVNQQEGVLANDLDWLHTRGSKRTSLCAPARRLERCGSEKHGSL
jgi:hypothetical protein